MTESPIDHDLDPLEGEVRAMLHRRASEVHPQRPGWQSLDTPQVRLAYSPHRGLRPVQRRSAYFRPATAVASVLVIVFVGVMVVDRMGGSGSSEADESSVATEGGDGSDVWPAPPSGAAHPEIPVPGNEAYDPHLAVPLHPVTDEAELAAFSSADLAELLDPVDVATSYLASVDIEAGSGPIADLEVDIAEHEDRSRPDLDVIAEVTVAWSTWGEAPSPALTSGFVYLRRSEEADLGTSDGLEDQPWVVVGARTQDLDVAGVHRDQDTLIFGVSRLEDASGISQLRIEVDDSPLESQLAEGDQDTFTIHAVDEEPVRLQMHHVDGEPLSIFDMTIPALGEGYDALAAAEVR